MTQDPAIQRLVDQWADDYAKRTRRDLYAVDQGGFSYVYDVDGGRVVCVSGRSRSPDGPRDTSRQSGSPPPPQGDHRGHLIAHSMGGGLDVNLFDQDAHLNLSKGWRSIEKYAAEHPGTPVGVHLRYEDEFDRPAGIDYVHVDPKRGLVVDRFANPRSREDQERVRPPSRGLAWPNGRDRQLDRSENRERA